MQYTAHTSLYVSLYKECALGPSLYVATFMLITDGKFVLVQMV